MKVNHRDRLDRPIGGYIVEARGAISGVRELREAILSLIYRLQEDPASKGLLVVSESRITNERIDQEWEKARTAFKSNLVKRMHLVRVIQGEYIGLPTDFGNKARQQLAEIATTTQADNSRAIGDRFSNFIVAKLLILQWLKNEGPTTTIKISQETGYSYPTVAKALQRLKRYLRRHSDRRIELTRFPNDEWARLVAVSEEVRAVVRFVDRSGRPRTTESLLKKLARLNRADVAIGGVYGAKFHVPDLDLVGSPRLDLTVSCSRKVADFEFVRQLDAALEPSENFSEPPSVVVHVERSASPRFFEAQNGQQYADPIECLLDLHEARLEVQAAEFLDALIRKRGITNG